jgi:hypothetical protein
LGILGVGIFLVGIFHGETITASPQVRALRRMGLPAAHPVGECTLGFSELVSWAELQ